jgi:hypothetical protein
MTITIVCYRKAYPQEILTQLEPVLRKVGFTWKEIIGLFEERLREKGFEVFEIPDDPNDPCATDELRYLEITNEGAGVSNESKLPAPQVLRPSEIIRCKDGAYRQGFRLHSHGWPAERPIEKLFVPEYNGFHIGDLVQCRYDKEKCEWRPTGESKRVIARWEKAPSKSRDKLIIKRANEMSQAG